VLLNVYIVSVEVNALAQVEDPMEGGKRVKKALQKRVKSRRYAGKHKGRGKYKPKDPA
jgi:hypothetical protein